MSPKSNEHTHKLKRVKYRTGTVMYFCVGETCFKKFAPAMALGKKTICWTCEEPFLMNEYSIRLAKPHCQKCHKPKTEKRELHLESSGSVKLEVIPEIITSNSLDNMLSQLRNNDKQEDEEL